MGNILGTLDGDELGAVEGLRLGCELGAEDGWPVHFHGWDK